MSADRLAKSLCPQIFTFVILPFAVRQEKRLDTGLYTSSGIGLCWSGIDVQNRIDKIDYETDIIKGRPFPRFLP